MSYHHTQLGTAILVVCLVVAVLGATMMWQRAQTPMILMLAILATVAVVFHSLTVEIGDHELRWYFGPGLWTYRLPLDDIQSVCGRPKSMVERIPHGAGIYTLQCVRPRRRRAQAEIR